MILKCLNSILVITLLLCVGTIRAIFAQQESWQRIAPVGHSFTISMPTKAVLAPRRIPVSDADSIPVAVYYSLAGGKRYVVAAVFKTSPDTVPALSSYEKFIVAMEYSFKSDGVARSLAFERDISLPRVAGKQYRVKLGAYPGVARFLGTENAFYALLVIGADEGDGDVVRFLSSFELGEANTNAELSGISGNILSMAPASSSSNVSKTTPSPVPSVLAEPPEPWPQPVGPIIGGVLNGKAISLARPEYPAAARKNREAGMVKVQILIDELGNVIRAEAVDGSPNLRDAAVAAALRSRFTPTRLMGQPVKVTGIIIYNFVAR